MRLIRREALALDQRIERVSWNVWALLVGLLCHSVVTHDFESKIVNQSTILVH
jgi:hypothetical protein